MLGATLLYAFFLVAAELPKVPVWFSTPMEATTGSSRFDSNNRSKSTDPLLDSLLNAGFWLAQRPVSQTSPIPKSLLENETSLSSSPSSSSPTRNESVGTILSGPLFRFRAWELSLDPAIAEMKAALQGVLDNYTGLSASHEHWMSLRQDLEAVLRGCGFPLAHYSIVPQPVGAGEIGEVGSLQLRVVVVPGEGFKLGGLLGRGTRTKPEILLRLSLLNYGETFDEGRLALGLARLRRMGYYSSVDSIGLTRDRDRNLIYPLLQVGDDASNRIGGLLGYDSEAKKDGLSGYVDIHLVNIRGTARDFDFNFDSRPQANGLSDRQARFQYVEPWLPGLPLGLRLNGSVWLQDSVYDQLDGSAALFHDLDMHSRLEITFSRQWSLDRLVDEESQAYAGGLGWIADHRNRVPFPSRGYRLEIRGQGIRRDLADSSRYLVQGQIKGETYLPLVSRLLAHVYLESGGDWPRHPLALRGDRFDVGGARSLRGYREREFSTDLYGFAQLELQWLLAGQGRILAFASPGLIDRQSPSLWWTRVLGYGMGVQMGSKSWAVGLLYALNPERSLGQGLIHVTLDNRF